MNVSKTTIEGVASITQGGTSPVRKFIGRLPMDGSWSVKGTVQAVNPASGRSTSQQVVFNVGYSGICINGVCTAEDGQSGIASTQPSSNPFSGTAVTFALTNGQPSATPPVPPSFEVIIAAPTASGVTAIYGASLEVTALTP